ncbi:MAG: hypothetical protein E7170_02175 [Firmicutes bacterium]|nr:hypothetical protein [Bacillota bacterium]
MTRIVKKIITYFLTLILFLLFSAMIFILSCKTLITKENLSNYVKNIDILNVDLGIIFNLEEKGITLEEEIYKIAIESEIPKEIIKDIVKSEEINTILGDFFKNVIDYVLKNEKKPTISKETTLKMIELAIDSSEEYMNLMIEEEKIRQSVIEFSSKITNIVPERSLIIGEYTTDRINEILYFDMVNIYTLIIVVCIFICIVNKSIYKLFKYLGSVMILSGLIFVIIGCLNNLIGNFLSQRYQTLQNFILPLVTNVLTIIFKNGVLVSFSGVFIYLMYIIINRIKLNNKINMLLSKQ